MFNDNSLIFAFVVIIIVSVASCAATKHLQNMEKEKTVRHAMDKGFEKYIIGGGYTDRIWRKKDDSSV